MRYRFIEEQKATHAVGRLCRVLEVSRSGYYDWQGRLPSQRSQTNAKLLSRIRESHHRSRATYGVRRIHAELHAEGLKSGKKRIARLMRAEGLKAKRPKRFKATTDSRHALPVAANHLGRQFQVHQPNTHWASDITYIPTQEGWLYVAIILDLYSRRVVGWAMQSRMTVELVQNALEMALSQRCVETGLLLHSDRGSQYAATDYQALLNAHGILCSMSRKGNCWDNAVAESFFRTLKTELVYHQRYTTRAQAKQSIFEYIEVFYNRLRRHSHLNYQTPAEFEKMALAA